MKADFELVSTEGLDVINCYLALVGVNAVVALERLGELLGGYGRPLLAVDAATAEQVVGQTLIYDENRLQLALASAEHGP